MVANCALSATYILYMRICIQRVGFTDFDSVYYNNALAAPVMGLLSLVGEDWNEFLAD